MTGRDTFVSTLRDVDKKNIDTVGGKGANLGELLKIDGINVPDGFCVTTTAFQKVRSEVHKGADSIHVPNDIALAITRNLKRLGEQETYAVRSSATAEDLPAASFAGQYDTYLNVTGSESILTHVGKCWASLFTERAISYRSQNHFDHHQVSLAVVVQKMIPAQVSGVMFTADPLTSNRKIVSIEATYGLGEALVSGLVNPDVFKVHGEKIIERNGNALTEGQIVNLAAIGRKIEKHFGSPQDIEWCLADDIFYIVQSRPITTLFPVPETNDDASHVFVSVGHQQMMTDPMKPLGLSFFKLTVAGKMYDAAGRLFVDIAPMLSTPKGRQTLIETLGKSDPWIKDAMLKLVERGDLNSNNDQGPSRNYGTMLAYDPDLVAELISKSETSIEKLKQEIQSRSGLELLDFIVSDLRSLSKELFEPRNFGVVMTGMNAASWINEKMMEWLGEKNVADTLSLSVPNNITSQMGLDLLDVADVIRGQPADVEFLETVKDDDPLTRLGNESLRAINNYLDKYGVRCVGEIDITRPRWMEKPGAIVPLILNNIRMFQPGESKRKFDRGLQEASKKEKELLERLLQLPEGVAKAAETKRMIDLIRAYAGYREYPKFSKISRYFIYKQALLREFGTEDIYYLKFDELRDLVRTRHIDRSIIDQRKSDFKLYERLMPPRVLTSDGEVVTGSYKHEQQPEHSITGLAVSSGIVEGRARVIRSIGDAKVEPGDILVTSFTDPSWTPLFVSIKGLVTEVGGLMTHGAVIAREYGLPAVVGVDNATKLIKDGQWIRVNGTDGYVEIL